MGASKGKSKQKGSAKFNENVWDVQAPYLEDMYGQSGDFYKNAGEGVQDRIPEAADGMNDISEQANPAWQQQLQGGVYGDMNLGNQFNKSIQQSLNNPSASQRINNMIMGGEGNNYADAMRGQFVEDANMATDNMLQNLDARASASGMSGGSRHGTATADGFRDINKNLQRNLAQTGFDTFDKDLDRKLGIAQQADQATLQRQQMLQNMIGQQQGTANMGIQGGQGMQNLGMGQFAPYMMPGKVTSQHANALGRPTILGSGTQSSRGRSSSKGVGL